MKMMNNHPNQQQLQDESEPLFRPPPQLQPQLLRYQAQSETTSVPVSVSSSAGSFSERPLFGDHQRSRVSGILIVACGLLIVATLLTLVLVKFDATNLLSLLVILSFSGSHSTLFYWYRIGDLDPKFRHLLIWNSVNLCLMCVVAVVYYVVKK